MAKYILEQIKIEGAMVDLISKTDGDNVALSIEGRDTTLAAELASILSDIAALPSTADVDTAVSTAIDALIDGAPGTYDTLKEIADYITQHEDVVSTLNAAIGGKVDKVDGMGLSANDFTDALKTRLEALKLVASSTTNGYILIDGTDTKVYEHPTGAGYEHIPAGGTEGQILTRTASGYAFADAPAGVRYGSTIPVDMKDGELFVRII